MSTIRAPYEIFTDLWGGRIWVRARPLRMFSKFRQCGVFGTRSAAQRSIFRPVPTFWEGVCHCATGRSVKSRCHSAGIRRERWHQPRSFIARRTRCRETRSPLQRRGFWSVVARCATMPRRSDLDDPFGTLTWTSSRSPMETPHSAAAVWWLAYEPRGLICSAAAAICWTPIFIPDRRYRPWNSRWKCRLRKSTSVNPAASASARVNGSEVLRDMQSSLGEFEGLPQLSTAEFGRHPRCPVVVPARR